MKSIKTIFTLVLLSAVLFSCSNARYGHMKKVKKNEKATVQKHERKNKSAQPAEQIIEEIAAAEEATKVNEAVVAENAAAETTPVATSPVNVKTPKTSTNNTVNTIKSSKKEVVKNNSKEAAKTTEAAKKKGSSGKSQIVAAALCFFLGYIGIHRFYLGYTTIGILQILTLGGCGIWALIDLIRILTGDLQPIDGEYEETL